MFCVPSKYNSRASSTVWIISLVVTNPAGTLALFSASTSPKLRAKMIMMIPTEASSSSSTVESSFVDTTHLLLRGDDNGDDANSYLEGDEPRWADWTKPKADPFLSAYEDETETQAPVDHLLNSNNGETNVFEFGHLIHSSYLNLVSNETTAEQSTRFLTPKNRFLEDVNENLEIPYFQPLDCNVPDCQINTTWMQGGFAHAAAQNNGTIIIPCGTCVWMDYHNQQDCAIVGPVCGWITTTSRRRATMTKQTYSQIKIRKYWCLPMAWIFKDICTSRMDTKSRSRPHLSWFRVAWRCTLLARLDPTH
ncbi:hypothetical protein ACA910_007985 [Epithemia clementina (nom. ined.)]